MPDIFDFHGNVIGNFEHFFRSFTTIRATDIREKKSLYCFTFFVSRRSGKIQKQIF